MSRPLKRLTVGALTDYGLKPYEMIEGETRQVFTEWMPFAGLRDTVVSSSVWSKETNAITLSGATLSGDRSSVLVTAVEPGVYPIQCTATLANGEKITKTWRIDIRPLDESADDVAGVTCPTLLEPPDGEIDVDGESVDFVVSAPATSDYVSFFLWIDGETMPEAPTDTMTYNGVNWVTTVLGLVEDTLYNWYASVTRNGVTSTGCDVGQFSFTTAEPPLYACGSPPAGSYLISPAWSSTYPKNYVASAPYTLNDFSGNIVLGTNKAVGAEGDPEPAPLYITLTLTLTTWSHVGASLASGADTIEIIAPPNDDVWAGAVLRRLDVAAVPVQFSSSGLMICERSGYSNIGGSAWKSSGWGVVGEDYKGDFSGYTPGDAGLPGTRGEFINVAYAKYFTNNTYVVAGVNASSPTSTIHRFATPGGGVPAVIGNTFSGENLYAGPAVTRNYGNAVLDVTEYLGDIYVLWTESSFGVRTVHVEKINASLVPTDSWSLADASFEVVTGLSVRGTRCIVAADANTTSARRFYVLEMNGSGLGQTLTLVHMGVNEIDPAADKLGAYVWADPLCGWLKQKDRWISPVIGV